MFNFIGIFVFLVVPFRLIIRMFIGYRHFMVFVMLLELVGVRILLFLCLYCPVE